MLSGAILLILKGLGAFTAGATLGYSIHLTTKAIMPPHPLDELADGLKRATMMIKQENVINK